MITNPFEYLEQNAQRSALSQALIGQGTNFSNQELFEYSRAIAWLLRQSGVRPGEGVLLSLSPEVEAAAMFAVFHEAGFSAHYAPALEGTDFSELGFRWHLHAGSQPALAGFNNILLSPESIRDLGLIPDDFAPVPLEETTLCRVIFSSGTTGQPKPVPFTLQQLQARSEFLELQVASDKPFLCALGFDVSFGFMTLYASARYAQTYYFSGSLEWILELVANHGIRSLATSPIGLDRLISGAEQTNTSLRSLVTATTTGGFLSSNTIGRLAKLSDAQALSLYGSTEVGFVARRVGKGTDAKDAGELFSHAEVEILDEAGLPVAAGESGIVRVRTPWKGASYLGSQVNSETIFKDGFFYPGDLGRIVNERLFISGRSNLVVNVGGVKIDPTPIEQFCVESLPIREAAGFQHLSSSGQSNFVMAIVPEKDFDQAAALLRLRKEFGTKAPSLLYPLKEIPRNSLGKPLRQLLQQQLLSQLEK